MSLKDSLLKEVQVFYTITSQKETDHSATGGLLVIIVFSLIFIFDIAFKWVDAESPLLSDQAIASKGISDGR